MRRFDFRDSVGGRSTSQIILESVKDAIVKPLRVAGLTRVLVLFSIVGEMRAAIVSLKDKVIHLMKYPRMRKVKSGLSDRLVSLNIRGFRGQRLEYYEMLRRLRPKVVIVQETLVKREDWAVNIPGYEFFHDFSREGSNHGVLLGISKGHVAQRIPGIEGKLVVAHAQLNEQTIKFCLFYLPCNSTTERASTKGKLLELLLTWSFDILEEHYIISGDFNMSNSALGLLLKRHNTGYSVVDFSGSSKSFFDLTLYKASNRKPKRFYLTPSILKEIRAKDLAAAEWHKATESKNSSKKKEVLGNLKDNPLDINHDISWDDVRMVLMSLALHKAPGGDGLEVGWYKVLFNDYDVYCPESPMAKALLNLLQTIWRSGKIPKVWNITEIVPIPKKGDPQLLDNYRGIALIPVGMKILGRIIIGRINRQLEARKKISFLQAGLRRGEEAMAQVVSLYDILSRRRVAKKETFVAFIDFKKAYDTVPIEALLRK
ncbi:LINE-1 reverse transcriptase-like protein, partial [Smittium culicis]